MKVNYEAILLKVGGYNKKNEKTGIRDGDFVNTFSLLIDAQEDNVTSGKVIETYAGDSYIGPKDFSNFKRFEKINMTVETELGSQFFKLIDIKKLNYGE